MYNLVERVKAALVNPNDSLWFPELTAELAEAGWKKLYRTTGISHHDYTTGRVIVRDVEAPCRIIAYLPVHLDAEYTELVPQVEILDDELINHYEESGINFYTAEEIDHANILEILGDGIAILKRLPTLYSTIATLVKSIHIIKLADDDYDVSFSEPHLPFSIFVSVPRQRSEVYSLRVAEAVVHEAMHLQLTLIELILPLIKSRSRQYYSPWRGEFRDALGMLHGLYVFCVVNEFLRAMQTQASLESDALFHVKRRRSEIHDQVRCIQSFETSKDLTEVGLEFVQRILAGYSSN